jgi:hypothetical protein
VGIVLISTPFSSTHGRRSADSQSTSNGDKIYTNVLKSRFSNTKQKELARRRLLLLRKIKVNMKLFTKPGNDAAMLQRSIWMALKKEETLKAYLGQAYETIMSLTVSKIMPFFSLAKPALTSNENASNRVLPPITKREVSAEVIVLSHSD